MAQYTVQTKSLRDEAAGLRRLKAELEREIDSMRSISARYLTMWDGQAKAAFVQNVNKHMNLLKRFTNNMEKFAQALEKSAQRYVDGENYAIREVNDK